MPRGNGKKNHSVNRERSREEQARHRRNVLKRHEARQEQMRKKSQALAYWRGEEVDHP